MIGIPTRRGAVCTVVRSWHCLRQEAGVCKRPPTRRSLASSASPTPSPSAEAQQIGHVLQRQPVDGCPLGRSITGNVGDGPSIWNRLLSASRSEISHGAGYSTSPRVGALSEIASAGRLAADAQLLSSIARKGCQTGGNPISPASASWGSLWKSMARGVTSTKPSNLCSDIPLAVRRGGGGGGGGGGRSLSGMSQVVRSNSFAPLEVPRGLGGSGLPDAIPRGQMMRWKRGESRHFASDSWAERVQARVKRLFRGGEQALKGEKHLPSSTGDASGLIAESTERTKKVMESLSRNQPRVAKTASSSPPSSPSPRSSLSVLGRKGTGSMKAAAEVAGARRVVGISDKALSIVKGWGLAPAVAAKEVGSKYRQALALHVEGFWKRNYLILVGAVGVTVCLLLWRVMFGIASIFVNLSERMASAGFLALAAAMVTFGGLAVRRAYTINPDVVYRKAMRMINTSPAVLEVMGAPLTGTDVRAYVMSGGGLRIKNFKPKITTKRVYLIFPVRGAERRGLVSAEAKKRKGKYEFKLLAVDVPTAGAEQRLFLIGDEMIYKSGGGLISELRDPIVTAMGAQKEFEEEDDKEEEEEERLQREEEERQAEEEAQKLKEAAEEEIRQREEEKSRAAAA